MLLFSGARAGSQALDNQFVVQSANERSTLDRNTGILTSTVDVRLVNLGGRNLAGPLHAVIQTTPASGVEVVGALGGPGDALYGSYYVDLSPQLAGQPLAPGADVFTRLTFRRDRNVQMTYKVVPFGQLDTQGAPQLDVPGPLVVEEGQLLSFNVSATDPDNDLAALASESAVSNAVFSASASAGTLRFTPGYDQAGYHYFTFTARDARGLSDRRTVEVRVRNVNRPPVLSALPASTLAEGELLTVQLAVTDPDGDEPVLAATAPLPTNAVFFADSQLLVFAPDFSQAGDYGIPFEVSDGAATGNTERVDITVTDVPGAENPTNALTLVVNPVGNPTFAGEQRVTGFVNGAGGDIPTPVEMGIISGIAPVSGRRGQTLDVVVTGQAAGLFATAFAAGSQVSFGDGVQVQSVTVAGPGSLTARVAVDPAAALGNRSVQVITGNEAAYSLVAFTVQPAATQLSGRVLAPGTGQPVAGAIVTLEGTDRRVVTGADGSFTFNDPPLGAATLLINAPNQDIIRVPLDIQEGQTAALGDLSSEPTVFNPDAPAEVSVLSVIGRGATANSEQLSLAEWRRVVTDVFLLVGGTEAGVLDGQGLQLNPQVTGPGLHSLTPAGVQRLAEMLERGSETVALADLLFVLSRGFIWEQGGAPTLQEWLDALNARLRVVWANPGLEENRMPLVLFNKGRSLQNDPPVLQAETRLNPLQAHLLLASAIAYAGERERGHARVEPDAFTLPSVWDALVPRAYAQAPTGPRPFTSFWRGFATQKGNFALTVVNAAHADMVWIMSSPLLMGGPSLVGVLGSLGAFSAAHGLVAADLGRAYKFLSLANQVPEPPVIKRVYTTTGDNGSQTVNVQFRVSPTQLQPLNRGGDFFYSLYRFSSDPDAPRKLIGYRLVNPNTPIGGGDEPLSAAGLDALGNWDFTIRDEAPLPLENTLAGPAPSSSATWLYAMTVTRVKNMAEFTGPYYILDAVPWWTQVLGGNPNNPITFFRYEEIARRNFPATSDYSTPSVVTVTRGGLLTEPDQIEVNPVTADVYSLDAETQAILRHAADNLSSAVPFANAGFKSPPGARGLAVDSTGNLYSENASSDASFGGRIFQFSQPTGARALTGALNYFSFTLGFARPVEGGPMDMGPGWTPGYSREDLYQVDQLAGVVKKVPVFGSAPDYHRVGQPWAPLPFQARAVDLATRANGDATVLVERVGGGLLSATLEVADTTLAELETTEVTVVVVNPGGQTVNNVRMLPLIMTGDGALLEETLFAPAATNLIGGASVVFKATLRAVQPGEVRLQAVAGGINGNGETVGSAPSPANGLPVTIRSPLRVRAVAATPARTPSGTRFVVSAEFHNEGESDITGIVPVFESAPLPRDTEPGTASLAAGPSATGFALAPGASRTVTAEFLAADLGKLRFFVRGEGQYVGTGEPARSNRPASPPVMVSPIDFTFHFEPDSMLFTPNGVATGVVTVVNLSASPVPSVLPVVEALTAAPAFLEITPPAGPRTVAAGATEVFRFVYRKPVSPGVIRHDARVTFLSPSGKTVETQRERQDLTIGPVIKGRITDFQMITDLTAKSPSIRQHFPVKTLFIRLEEQGSVADPLFVTKHLVAADQGYFNFPVPRFGRYKLSGFDPATNTGFSRILTPGVTPKEEEIICPVTFVTELIAAKDALKEVPLKFNRAAFLETLLTNPDFAAGVSNTVVAMTSAIAPKDVVTFLSPVSIKLSYEMSGVEELIRKVQRREQTPRFYGADNGGQPEWTAAIRMHLYLRYMRNRADNQIVLMQTLTQPLIDWLYAKVGKNKVEEAFALQPMPYKSDQISAQKKLVEREDTAENRKRLKEMESANKKETERRKGRDRQFKHTYLNGFVKRLFADGAAGLLDNLQGGTATPAQKKALVTRMESVFDLVTKAIMGAFDGSILKSEASAVVASAAQLGVTYALMNEYYLPLTQSWLNRAVARCQDPELNLGGSDSAAYAFFAASDPAETTAVTDITTALAAKLVDLTFVDNAVNYWFTNPYLKARVTSEIEYWKSRDEFTNAQKDLEARLAAVSTLFKSLDYARDILHTFILNPGNLVRAERLIMSGDSTLSPVNEADAAASLLAEPSLLPSLGL